MTPPTTAVDQDALGRVLGQAITDMGAALNGALVMIGEELGLWRGGAGAGPSTTDQIAERTGVAERYVREWCSAQAASGYLAYDPGDEAFTLSAEQALAFADENSPLYMLGGYHVVSAAYKDRARIAERMRTGAGFGWHEHDPELFIGTEQFFRPGYRAH